MSHKVAISNLLKENEISDVTSKLKSYCGNIVIIDNPSKADISIVPLIQIMSVMKPKCLTITPLALNQMIERKIDLFSNKFITKKILSYFLDNIKIKVMIDDEIECKRVKNKIHGMQGIIVDSNPDIIISQHTIATKTIPIVPVDWVDAQAASTTFIDPSNYRKTLYKKLKKPNAKKTPVAYAKNLSTQTDTVQTLMQISENTPSIENFFTASQMRAKSIKKEENLIKQISKKPSLCSTKLPETIIKLKETKQIEEPIFPVPPQDIFDALLEEDRQERLQKFKSQNSQISTKNTQKNEVLDDKIPIKSDESVKNIKDIKESPKILPKPQKSSQESPPEVSEPARAPSGVSLGDWLMNDKESDSDDEEDIDKHLSEMKSKVLPFLSPKKTKSRSQFDMSSESDIDSPIKPIIRSPIKTKTSTINSPIRKACSQISPNVKRICKSILSMKPAHEGEMHDGKVPTLEETIRFTQKSQLSQSMNDNIEYMDENYKFSQNVNASPSRDPLILALLD